MSVLVVGVDGRRKKKNLLSCKNNSISTSRYIDKLPGRGGYKPINAGHL